MKFVCYLSHVALAQRELVGRQVPEAKTQSAARGEKITPALETMGLPLRTPTYNFAELQKRFLFVKSLGADRGSNCEGL